MRLLRAFFIAFLVIGLQSSVAEAGTFRDTGDMTTVRSSPRGVLLDNGRVFVTGGRVDSSEIFDPTAEGLFTALPTLNPGRYGPAVATLPDGRVLIAGGEIENVVTDTAVIYDPRNDVYTQTTTLPRPMKLMAAAPLPDGRVLLAGGGTDYPGDSNVAWFFDPATERFSNAPLPANPLGEVAAVSVPDGRVIFAGWRVEIFDPTKGTFESTGTEFPAGDQVTALADLANGDVLAIGRWPVAGKEPLAMTLNGPRFNRFEVTRNPPKFDFFNGLAVGLGAGRALVGGGYVGDQDTASAQIFESRPKLQLLSDLHKGLVGRPLAPRSIHVESVGGESASITRLTRFAGSVAKGLKILKDECADRTLAFGDRCEVSVRYRPIRHGKHQVNLGIEPTSLESPSLTVEAADLRISGPKVRRSARNILIGRLSCLNGPCRVVRANATVSHRGKTRRLKVTVRKRLPRGGASSKVPVRVRGVGKKPIRGTVRLWVKAGIPGGPAKDLKHRVRVR